jgi:putative tryptophan/tyrosine transport system substrate-binding protein
MDAADPVYRPEVPPVTARDVESAAGEARGWSRRRFVQAVAAGVGLGSSALLAGCGGEAAAARQSAGMARVVFLSGNVGRTSPEAEAFRQAMRGLGYVEGRNLTIQWHFAAEDAALPALAAEIVQTAPDAIVAAGTPATQAAKSATAAIPIVGTALGDPVATGLVSSLARPGGNVTGVRSSIGGLNAKRLELLKEAFPQIERVAVIGNPTNPVVALQFAELEEAGPALGVRVERLEARSVNDFATMFASAMRRLPDAVVGLLDALMLSNRRRVVEFAAGNGLPSIYSTRDFVEVGGLMTYSPSFPDMYRRSATYVDKILKGARPGDLPMERPRRFRLVLNMDAARALGVTIPLAVRVQTDEIIDSWQGQGRRQQVPA